MKIDVIGTMRTFEDTGIEKNPIDAGAAWNETEKNHVPEAAMPESLEEKSKRSVEQLQKEFAESQKRHNEWRDRIVKMNMAQAADAVPDDEARINALARQFNAPPEMVRNYRQLFEAQARDQKLSKLPPKTADFLSNPNNARIAHDDLDNIMELEALVTNPDGFTIAGDFGDRAAGARLAPIDFAMDSVRNLAAGAIGGVIKGGGSVSSYIARALPILGTNAEADLYNPVPLNGDEQAARYREAEKTGKKLAEVSGADELYRIGERVTEAIAGDGMKEYGFASRAWMSGMQSLGNMGPAVLGSIITRNPAFALTWAGLSEGGESFMGDVLKNKGFAQATAHGFVNGGIEVGTEFGPISRLIKDAVAGTPFIKTLLRNWARETPSEMLATAGQTLSDKISDKKDDQDFGDVILEWFSELPTNELETIIATLPMSLGFSGAARISQIRTSRATEKGIAALNDSAKASKVRGRAKDVYETLVRTQTEGTPLENAYVNTEAWQTYFQKQGLDPKEQAERYGVTNYDEAVTTGTDLTIPFPEYQSGFSASDHAPYFVRDTKLSEKGMTANERETYLQRLEEQVRETEELLEKIGKESENARAVNDILSELTDEMAVQLESRYDKKTARTQATIAARAFVNPVHKDIVERAREEGKELSSDEIAGKIRDWFARYGLTVNANATPTTVNTRRNIDPYIDSQLEKLRRNELPKERDVYGQSLMEYIREKGGLRPDDITRDLVKNKQLPRSILNEKGMGADEFAALQEVLDFGIGNEQTQGDNALLDALVDEYTTGEKRYSNTQINGELLSEAQTLNDLANDLKAAGIDITTDTDNAAVREALSKYYEAQNGENTREEPETSETERYEQRGFTESEEPTAEERAEANRQYDEIEKKYKETPLWMKAPNGEPTKLTERQWVQVRTPNFKRWFGDWEKAGIRERLEGQEPILVQSEFTEETAKIKKSEAAALLKEPFSVKKNIGEVFVTKNGIRESIGHSRNAAKLDVIPYLREILEQAEYLDTLNDFGGKAILNHYFATRIEHAGKTKLVFLRVRKSEGRNNQLYVHDVFVEDDIKQKASSETNRRLNNPVRESLRNTDLYKSILQDIYSTDNESVSKVVDENGEPMVVYHGTVDGGFNVFLTDGRDKTSGTGAFFTTSKYVSKTYSGGVGEKADDFPQLSRDYAVIDEDGEIVYDGYGSLEEAESDADKESGETATVVYRNRDTEESYFSEEEAVSAIKNELTSLNMSPEIYQAFLNIRNPFRFDAEAASWSSLYDGEEETDLDNISRKVRKEGKHDGVIFHHVADEGPFGDGDLQETGDTIVAFTPNQIKSAIGNIGTFSENPHILYQFIGERGASRLDRAQEATIRMDNLSVARDMETAGKDAKAIKLATGWERGADGKWRYEIDDSRSTFSPKENAILSEVLDYPELFDAYPDLKNVRVMVTDKLGDGNLGGYSHNDNIIVISERSRDKRTVLMHEIQHVVQRIEGFAKGGGRSAFESDFIRKIRSPRERAAIALSMLWDKVENSPEYKKAQSIRELFNKAETEEEWSALEKEFPEVTDPSDIYKETREYKEFKKARDEYEKNFGDDPSIWLDINRSNAELAKYKFRQYQKLAGETEARNVQSRLAMTPEQRRESLASETEDVSREDQIFLYQSFKSGKEGKVRGATIINLGRTMRIDLFKYANYSTFVHESAHFMLEVYGDLASDPNASAYIRNEYATIRKYLGAEDGKPITREQHEKFARSFEAYLMEGKAPSPELQSIFSRFKTWLYNIYKTLTALDVKLNKDIREVFDRMMATDNEIAIMRESDELLPLFATAEIMGVSQDEFDAYRKIGDSELVKAQDIFRQKAMHAKLREKTKAYQEELEAEKKRVAREYDRDPVVTAFNDLTSDDGFSLNEDELRRVYGKAFMSKLPKRNGKRIYSKDGQVSLEDLAESLDFSSGDALIRAIARMPNRDQYVEDKARQNIMDREGDILNSDAVADEAENALHNEYMAERLKKELAVLNHLKQAGKAAKLSEKRKRIEQRKEAKRIEEDITAQIGAMKVAATSIIAEKKVKDIKPPLYLRAMQAASRKSRQALNKTSPDYAAAARQKQAEIMNNLLYKEAIRVQKELDKRTLQAKAIARKPLKDAVRTRDSLGVNKAKFIASKIGLGGNPDILMQRIHTEEKNREVGDAFQYDITGTLNDLNTATALDVLEDIRANWDQARRDKVMVINGRRVEIDRAAEEVSGKLREFGKTRRSQSRDDSARNTLMKIIGSLALYHTRMESFCDMVDGAFVGEEIGPMMRYLFDPVKQAATQTRLAQAEYTKKLSDIFDGFGFTKETIEAPELGYTFGKDTGYGKAELIHAMLHTGNMSNLQRLIVGRGWGTIQNGQVDTRRWNAFMSRMISEGRITEQDFDRVQQIWDVFDELKPKSQQAYKEVFGRYFDEITATPFFEFGKRYNGGYIPAIYDNRESKAGEKQLDPTRDLINEIGAALPKLAAGWGNSRVEGNHGPLLLDLGALRTHINRQILFSYMAPVNRDVSSLLNKQNVRDALRDYDPDFYGKVIKPWLSRAITQNLEATGKEPTPYDRVVRALRTRAGVSIMFGNIVNAVEQVFDMTAAYSKVKGRYLTDAFKTIVSDRAGTVQAVMEASPYMRGRMSAEIMVANGMIEQALRPGKLKKLDRWLIDNAYFLQASVDNFCGPLTWTAAYNQATEGGLSHSDAVAQADSVVRQIFGANAAEDISNFEGGAPLKRMFTQFSGYFVQRANLVAGEHSKIQRSDIANKKAAAAIMFLQTVLLPAWIGAALRKVAAGSDDDETFGSWLLGVFGWGTLNYGLSMGGWGGQAFNVATDYHRGKSFSSGRVFYPPAIKLVEDFFKAFKIFPDAWNGELDVPKFMKYMSDFERVVPGLPVIPARPVASLRYAHDVANDEVNPTSGYDFVRGIATGRASPDSK